MSEYIVDVGNADEEYVAYFKCKAETLMGNPIHGEIVRCKDCIHYRCEDDEIYPKLCLKMNIWDVEPDDFCAWAYRKSENTHKE